MRESHLWLTNTACLLLVLGSCLGCNQAKKLPSASAPKPSQRTVKVDGPLLVLSEQGWSDSEAEWFYSVTQGSQLIPYDWFAFLKTPDGRRPFIASLADFGYIPRNKSDVNPLGLPIGFAKDVAEKRSWVGLTCAACHTSLIEYGGKSYLIDGGPGMGDLQGLLKSLEEALAKINSDQTRFDDFAKSILAENDTPDERTKLQEAVEQMLGDRKAYNDRNLPNHADDAFGFGRVDAFGAILNEVTVRFLELPSNQRPANAPVSYPFLWDTPHHDKVQWNGSAPNSYGGSLARNVGEVLGVFGTIEIPAIFPLVGYSSTIQIDNLLVIEATVKALKSPLWPIAFSELNPAAVESGRKIYQINCAECHVLDGFDRDDRNRRIEAKMSASGTDPLMASNFRTREAETGRLEGSRVNFNPIGPEFGQNSSGETLLIHEVVGTIIGGWKSPPTDRIDEIKLREPILKDALNKYKARPLNGIWSTSPYLHNGSVPTLRALLKPKDRPSVFWVGSRKFNPMDVGFETTVAPGRSKFDTSRPGNSNAGHEYGNALDEKQTNDLLEFLKSL